ncbi:MAG: ATP-binding protein [Agathobacter sp.]
MFVGRKRELEKLNKMYHSSQFEFAVLYGRRRVGKTTLIREFIKEKPAVYYMAVEGTKSENLAGLSKALLERTQLTAATPEFRDFEALLDYIDSLAKSGERLLIAIDEYPYLAASYPAISSMMQSHIDRCWKDSRLFLILCGSSMNFMEEQVLGYKSPLYGRRSAQFKIHPFTFWETREMLGNYSPGQQAIFYGVTGGIPEYLSRIDMNLGVDENVIQLFFEESGRLFEEPVNLMKQELKEPMTYHSIIAAIASGASRLNEIATKTGLETSGCSNQLSSLISLGMVKKETPVTEPETGRKTLYQLSDSMFLFWYRFVRPNVSSIIRGVGEQVYDSIVKPQMNDFMGSVFEEICKQYLYLPEVYKDLPFPLGNAGRWWGNNRKKKRQEEIDIMSVSEDKALFAECKWRNEKVDAEVIHTLIERGELFQYPEKHYFIFSKSGFKENVAEYAARNSNVHLIDFHHMTQGISNERK